MNKEQLTILATELAKSDYTTYGQDYPAIAAALNERPQVANPTPQGTVPHRWTLHQILATVVPLQPTAVADVVAVYGWPIINDIRAAFENDDRVGIADYFMIVSSAFNSAAKAAAIAMLAQTELDPTWQATIADDSIATSLGLPTATEMDVQLCLHPELWSGE